GFTRALARELGSRGIIVNGIAPGYLRTEMSHGLDEDQLGQIVRRTPAGRLGEPADIARAVQFLTDPANTYLTGQILVVDRGLPCRAPRWRGPRPGAGHAAATDPSPLEPTDAVRRDATFGATRSVCCSGVGAGTRTRAEQPHAPKRRPGHADDRRRRAA